MSVPEIRRDGFCSLASGRRSRSGRSCGLLPFAGTATARHLCHGRGWSERGGQWAPIETRRAPSWVPVVEKTGASGARRVGSTRRTVDWAVDPEAQRGRLGSRRRWPARNASPRRSRRPAPGMCCSAGRGLLTARADLRCSWTSPAINVEFATTAERDDPGASPSDRPPRVGGRHGSDGATAGRRGAASPMSSSVTRWRWCSMTGTRSSMSPGDSGSVRARWVMSGQPRTASGSFRRCPACSANASLNPSCPAQAVSASFSSVSVTFSSVSVTSERSVSTSNTLPSTTSSLGSTS